MKIKQVLHYLLTISVLLFALTDIEAKTNNQTESNPPAEEVIFQWNRVLTDTIRTPGAHPSATIFPIRSYAMMHAAMFDAVNSIDGRYTPYLTDVPGSKNASIEAAAAIAAHDVLVALYPTRQAIYDAELANSLTGLEENRVRQGIRVGQIVAQRILEVRANDGWNAPLPAYVLPPTPGNWQPTPPNFPVAGYTQYPAVLPFATTSSSQFVPPPPPSMTSGRYTLDFNEVKEIGSVTSATRTADQTQVARLWAVVGTPTQNFMAWNNVARSVSVSRGLTTPEIARLYALFNIAFHDALQTSMTSKYQYGLWRPVTAIRRADEDGNPNTAPDAAWLSLITNPPYPSYAGNMATIGMTHATIFALVFGRDDIPFTQTWENGPNGTGGATRSYSGFAAMAQEQADARIYGGIHYRFDNIAGQSIGRGVANYVFQNFMRPR